MSWLERSREVIAQVDASLPADATFEQRKKAVQDAYPFGPRQYHPYKQWLKARREYLARIAGPSDDEKKQAWKAKLTGQGYMFGGGE